MFNMSTLARAMRYVDRHQLFLLFLLALAIRCVGLLWGGTHSDENPGAAARVLTGQLIPNQHYYPPLLNYIVAFGYAVMYVLGLGVGVWHSTAEFRDQFSAILPHSTSSYVSVWP